MSRLPRKLPAFRTPPEQLLPAACSLTRVLRSAPASVSVDEVFRSRRVLVFGVPGVFIPSCDQHIKEYSSLRHSLREITGCEAIACVLLNDYYVLREWLQQSGLADQEVSPGISDPQIEFYADINGEFTELIGQLSFFERVGWRSQNYSLLTDDGNVLSYRIEDRASLEGFGATRASTIVSEERAEIQE